MKNKSRNTIQNKNKSNNRNQNKNETRNTKEKIIKITMNIT